MNLRKVLVEHLLKQLNIKVTDKSQLTDEDYNIISTYLTKHNQQAIQAFNSPWELSPWFLKYYNKLILHNKNYVLALTTDSATISIHRSNNLNKLHTLYQNILDILRKHNLDTYIKFDPVITAYINCYEYFKSIDHLYIKPTFFSDNILNVFLEKLNTIKIQNYLHTIIYNPIFNEYIYDVYLYYVYQKPKLVVSYEFSVNDKYSIFFIPAGLKIMISLSNNEHTNIIFTYSAKNFNSVESIIKHLLQLMRLKKDFQITKPKIIHTEALPMIILTKFKTYFLEYKLINIPTALTLINKTISIEITPNYNIKFNLPSNYSVILYKPFSKRIPQIIVKKNNKKIKVLLEEFDEFINSI